MLLPEFGFSVRTHSPRWERTAEFASPLNEMSVKPQSNLTAQVNYTKSLTADTQDAILPDCAWTAEGIFYVAAGTQSLVCMLEALPWLSAGR